MGNLASAYMSPEIVAGELRWGYGTTFTIEIEVTAEDQDGTPVILGGEDNAELHIYDRTEQEISLGGSAIWIGERGCIEWRVDEVLSNQMTPGTYTATIIVNHAGERTPVMSRRKVVVWA